MTKISHTSWQLIIYCIWYNQGYKKKNKTKKQFQQGMWKYYKKSRVNISIIDKTHLYRLIIISCSVG